MAESLRHGSRGVSTEQASIADHLSPQFRLCRFGALWWVTPIFHLNLDLNLTWRPTALRLRLPKRSLRMMQSDVSLSEGSECGRQGSILCAVAYIYPKRAHEIYSAIDQQLGCVFSGETGYDAAG